MNDRSSGGGGGGGSNQEITLYAFGYTYSFAPYDSMPDSCQDSPISSSASSSCVWPAKRPPTDGGIWTLE